MRRSLAERATGVEAKMKSRTVMLAALAAFAIGASASAGQGAGTGGSNDQVVVVKGSVTNTAKGGATAKVNVGAVDNTRVGGSNRQTVVVGGSIVNSAAGNGSKAEVNIGSVSNGKE
jgi:hypothetical protein